MLQATVVAFGAAAYLLARTGGEYLDLGEDFLAGALLVSAALAVLTGTTIGIEAFRKE